MGPLTAVCFSLCGIALILKSFGSTIPAGTPTTSRIAQAAAFLGFAISLAGIVEYALGSAIVGESMFHPGPMAWGVVLGLLFVALALIFLDIGFPGAARFSTVLALLASLMGLTALVRYLYGVEALYRFLAFPPGGVPTALLLFFLGVGTLSSFYPGTRRISTGQNPASTLRK